MPAAYECLPSRPSVAGNEPAGRGALALGQLRILRHAAVEGDRAARVEAAAARDRGGIGRLAREQGARVHARVDGRHDRQERLRIRMLRIAQHLLGGTDLDDPAEVHHGHAVAQRPGHADVVRDQEHREGARAAQLDQQTQHLRAHRDVERGDGLVADERLGLQRERRRDHDALALTARELMRVAAPEAVRRRQAGVVQRRDASEHAVLALGHPGRGEALLHRCADGAPRIERLIGILEDQLHAPPQSAEIAVDGLIVELDAAGARLLQAEQRARKRRLAAARLAHEAERLSASPDQVDAIDRTHQGARPRW